MTATWKNGPIILDASPPPWPDGCRLTVELAQRREDIGMREEDWPTDKEGIARLLAEMDKIEPLEISPEEEAEFWAWRATCRGRVPFTHGTR